MLYFQDLRLFLCRLTRGASSQAYQLLVKKLSQGHKTQQKLTICFNNEAILQFENTILKKKSFPVFKTKNKICLDTFSFGEEMTNIIRQKGPPHCINNDVFGEEIIEIFGYRESILDKPVKILFFTCRKKYFFGEYLFTGKFREIQAQLAQTILKKYNIQDMENPDSFYIEDEQGSLLCFYDDGFSLFIKYYNPEICNLHPYLMSVFQGKNRTSPEMSTSVLENRL